MKDIFDLQNPWRNPGYTFPQTSYIKRNVFEHLFGDMGHKEVTVVVGSQQEGKTFLMKKLIEKLLFNGENDPRQLFYFNFDSLTGYTDLKKSIIVTKDYLHKEKKGAMDVAFLPAWAAYSLENEIIGDIH